MKKSRGELLTGFFTAAIVVVGSIVFLCVFWWIVEAWK